MSTSPFRVDQFGALDLRRDPEEVGATGAVDILNTDTDRPGLVRTRSGYSLVTTAEGSALFGGLWSSETSAYVLAHYNTRYVAAVFAGTGAIVATSADAGGVGVMTFADLGTPDSSYTYFANGGPINRFDAVAGSFSAPTATVDGVASRTMPQPYVLGITPRSDRLVAASFASSAQGPNGAASSPHHVYFSEPGKGEEWTTTNFLDLGPGDGDEISALATWGDQLYIFKHNRFWVMTGESTSATGKPVFNVREVRSGVGCTGPRAIVAARDGLYFMSSRGLMRTTGGPPDFVGAPLEPLFSQTAPAAWTGQEIMVVTSLATAQHIHAFEDRIYMALPGALGSLDAPTVTLVYDIATNSWLYWDIPMAGVCGGPGPDATRRIWFSHGAINEIYRMDSDDDNGVPIVWHHTSGAYDPSGESRVSITMESALWGTGGVKLQVANDHAAFDAGSTVALGTAPAVAEGWQQIDREGTWWQHCLSGVGVGSVSRLVHYFSFTKPAGLE